MSRLRFLALPAALLAVGLLLVGERGGWNAGEAQAQSQSSLLGQLRRNAKVSERLNAGFFRAPQVRGFVGSAFRPTDSDTAFTVDAGNSSLSLDETRPGTELEVGADGKTTNKLKPEEQRSATFEYPLDVPNRAEVIDVDASYSDASGGNGLTFSLVQIGRQGESQEQMLEGSSEGVRSQGGSGTFSLALRNRGFRVDNSRFRYVLRVRFDNANAGTRLQGMSIQEVIGRGVPGAPTSTPTPPAG